MNSFRRLFDVLRFSWQRLPVTTLLLLGAAALFAVRLSLPVFHSKIVPQTPFPGMLEVLVYVESPEIRGYFRLWDGEWWRILVTCMHHANVLHLLLNSMFIWTCASVLERRMGLLVYTLFVVSSALASTLLEISIESNMIGLSGVGYALFGALLVLRRTDPIVAEVVNPRFITAGLVWLLLCFVTTWAKVMMVANGAHVGGFLYGLLVGWLLFYVGQRRRWLATIALGSIHTLLCLLVVAAMAPSRNGAYFAWRARQTTGSESLAFCRKATHVDPRQIWAWKVQIRASVLQNDLLGAWMLTLQACKANRNEDSFVESLRFIWQRMSSKSEREEALAQFEAIFDKEAASWRQRVFGGSDSELAESVTTGTRIEPDDELPTPSLELHLDVGQDLFDINRVNHEAVIRRMNESLNDGLDEPNRDVDDSLKPL